MGIIGMILVQGDESEVGVRCTVDMGRSSEEALVQW